MNELERAGVAMRDRPTSTPDIGAVERRATELTRRRRVGWAAATMAVVLIAVALGVGALRARSDDESIVVGPSPTSDEATLAMALHGVPDQATADEVASIMRNRIQRMNRGGSFTFSGGQKVPQYDERLSIDMSAVEVSATPAGLSITGPAQVLARLRLAPAIWRPGYPSMVAVQSDAGPATDGTCPADAALTISVVDPHCYVVGAASISPDLDQSIARPTASPSGGLLVPWGSNGGDENRVRTLAEECNRPAPGSVCPVGQVAIRVADGRVGLFTFSPATPPGTPILVPVAPMSFDESFGWAEMLSRPLPPGVEIEPPPIPDFVSVATAQAPIPAGSPIYAGANVVFAPVARAYVPASAITDPAQANGRTVTVDVRTQSVIVEEMLD